MSATRPFPWPLKDHHGPEVMTYVRTHVPRLRSCMYTQPRVRLGLGLLAMADLVGTTYGLTHGWAQLWMGLFRPMHQTILGWCLFGGWCGGGAVVSCALLYGMLETLRGSWRDLWAFSGLPRTPVIPEGTFLARDTVIASSQHQRLQMLAARQEHAAVLDRLFRNHGSTVLAQVEGWQALLRYDGKVMCRRRVRAP